MNTDVRRTPWQTVPATATASPAIRWIRPPRRRRRRSTAAALVVATVLVVALLLSNAYLYHHYNRKEERSLTVLRAAPPYRRSPQVTSADFGNDDNNEVEDQRDENVSNLMSPSCFYVEDVCRLSSSPPQDGRWFYYAGNNKNRRGLPLSTRRQPRVEFGRYPKRKLGSPTNVREEIDHLTRRESSSELYSNCTQSPIPNHVSLVWKASDRMARLCPICSSPHPEYHLSFTVHSDDSVFGLQPYAG